MNIRVVPRESVVQERKKSKYAELTEALRSLKWEQAVVISGQTAPQVRNVAYALHAGREQRFSVCKCEEGVLVFLK